MGNNVYIGMRYVPIFDGAWVNNKSYEPLTIVEYGNNSYTSKKPVPAGTLPTNTTYWALTGNYNGQIAQINTDLDALKGRVNVVEKTYDINVSHRKCLFFGDSQCDPNRGGQAYGIYTQFCTNSGFVDGTNAKLYQKGGAGFCGAGQGKTFLNLLNDAISAAFFTASEVTDIVVAGGSNDISYGTADILNARSTWITTAKAHFPNARIFVALAAGDTHAARGSQIYQKLRAVYYDSPEKNVIPITNSYLPTMNSAALLPDDGLHFNGQGVAWVGSLIGNAVKTISQKGEWIMNTNVGANITRVSGYSGNPNAKLIFNTDDIIFSWVKGASCNPNTSQSITYNNGLLLHIGSTSTGAGHFLVANAESPSAQTYYPLPCFAWVANGTQASKYLLAGELVGVANTQGDVIEWYFRCDRAPASFNSQYFDFIETQIVIK